MRAFSIGYKIKDNQFLEEETSDGRNYANIIKDLELFEISVVSVPMNAYSLMKSIGDCFELKEVVAENAKTTD
nr:MAG TPA: prohead serine protease [Caudoviricetes sp.]DAY21440.1 MAG TPA: prohead serine protease [Caudoviricetes sp.]